ncbi:hypothetical protein DFH28DRAFT_928255 [Melampsora americana]|nr:hypothetical protein DFH28DRAFT_928255 [Melampsora americana]
MGNLGHAIKCSTGSQVKRKEPPHTDATRNKFKNDRVKLAWGNQKCKEIFEKVFHPNNPAADQQDDFIPDEQMQAYLPLPTEIGSDIGDEHPPEPLTLTQLMSGDSYKHQRLQEDAQWRDIMQKLFIAFMQGSERTANWGHDILWCHDYNDELVCSCSNALKRI